MRSRDDTCDYGRAHPESAFRLQLLYREADVLVLFSFDEALPVDLMEAMGMGLPCVSTGVAGAPELMGDGMNGLLVPPTDERSLACAILCLKNSPALRTALAQKGPRCILEQHGLAKNVERPAEVFRRRLSREPADKIL
jgi:colanic acid/amylovoran biosynthesis glycosyltransferase